MIATLKFNLNNENDKIDFDYAVNAHKAFRVLRDLDDELRTMLKYKYEEFTTEQLESIESIRQRLHELKLENDLVIE